QIHENSSFFIFNKIRLDNQLPASSNIESSAYLWLSIYFTISATVLISSTSSSEIWMPKLSSNSITNSTTSNESAPKSSVNDISGVTLEASTPKRSTIKAATCSKVVLSAMKILLNKILTYTSTKTFYFLKKGETRSS